MVRKDLQTNELLQVCGVIPFFLDQLAVLREMLLFFFFFLPC